MITYLKKMLLIKFMNVNRNRGVFSTEKENE
jgi:hypothetical protein